MIRSMTAFARGDRRTDWGLLSCELRSVNHRYMELSLRMPEELRVLEPGIRELATQFARRGKIECQVRFQPEFSETSDLSINKELAIQLARASREVDRLLDNAAPANAFDVLRWPGVLQVADADWDKVRAEAMQMLGEALEELAATRAREGGKLADVISQRLDAMEQVVKDVQKRLPEIMQRHRERLAERLAELRAELDEARLEQEMVILAQKIDVDEEMDRLDAHIGEVRRVLGQDQPVGRRLDFLMQELNREANTLGSKSVDKATTAASVELKVLIEQMREQVQNIE